MGNNIGGIKKKTKVMKINGEILKLNTPITTSEVVKDYPGHVLLEYEQVKKFGIRAKPLEPEKELKPNKIYFLLELPLFPKEEITSTSKVTRRVKSAVHMNAQDRLECLMLSRRSASDLSISKPSNGAAVQLKMKLPRSVVQKLIEESRDETEVAEKIMDLCVPNSILEVMEHHNNTVEAEISPHVLLFPLPIQSPVNSMLQLAELFCLAGLQVTFLNTQHNQQLLYRHTNIKSRFSQYPKFQFRAISDGLPDDHPRSFLQFGELISSLQAVAEPFLREILTEPDITCVIPDGLFYYAVDICNEVGVSVISFDTISPCCLWVYLCFPKLIEAGDIPFKGNELDMLLENVPGMEDLLRRRDFPFYRLTNCATDLYCQLALKEIESIPRSHGLILNTFEDLDGPLLSLIRSHCPQTYAIGPLHLQLKTRLVDKKMSSSNSLWEEDHSSIQWLDAQPIESVIYVSFGSLATLTKKEILEFWHGLVNSGIRFLWVMRSNLLREEEFSHQFVKELTDNICKERACIVTWAPQEKVLSHPAIGGFLTHSGWNSTLESIVERKPMICWAVYVDQRVTSRFVGEVWKIGLDMKDICDRYIIEKVVKDLMVTTNKDKFKKSVDKLSMLAKISVGEGGSSYNAFEYLVDDIKKLGRRDRYKS